MRQLTEAELKAIAELSHLPEIERRSRVIKKVIATFGKPIPVLHRVIH